MKLTTLLVVAAAAFCCGLQAKTEDKPDRPPTAAERVAVAGLLHSIDEAGSLEGAERNRAVSFLCAQQYLYWVNIAKLEAERSWYVENYIAIALNLLGDDEYFKECLRDPLRGNAEEIDGVVTPQWQNLGPYVIKSEEHYGKLVVEFNAFVNMLWVERERKLKAKVEQKKANKSEMATPRKPSD